MPIGTTLWKNPRIPRGSGWFASFALIALILTTGSAVAQEVRSGWDLVDSGTESDLLSAEALNGEMWAFGTGGIAGKSLDGGLTWQFDNFGTHDWTHSDSGFDSIAIASTSGTVIIIEDIGEGEEDILDDIPPVPTQERVNAIALTGSQSLVAVWHSGEIWQFDGVAWNNRSMGGVEDLLSISFLDSNAGLISGQGGTILATSDGGVTWDYRDAPNEVSSSNIVLVEYYSDIRAYAITEQGHILKSSKQGSVSVGFVWGIVEIEREYPPGGGDDFLPGGIDLDHQVNSMEVIGQFKMVLAGPKGYLALSLDGGNIVSQQMIPVSNETSFHAVAMQDGFMGVAVGDDGVILRTENAGEEEFVGFEVVDFNDFGQFVDYSKERLIDGLVATAKIVLFGIAMGFTIGIILSMLKTSPTSLKNVAQTNRFQLITFALLPFWALFQLVLAIINGILLLLRSGLGLPTKSLENPIGIQISELRQKSAQIAANKPLNITAIRLVGSVLLVLGFSQIFSTLDEIRALNLDGWEHIYAPVGSPASFALILLGIALIILGSVFASCNGDFSIKDLHWGASKRKFSINPWGIRPLNAIATVYTDIFRNTPLIVQFMFIHFGFELGRRIQEPGLELFNFDYLEAHANFLTNIIVTYDTNPDSLAYGRPIGGILEDRAYISAIFALGLNSGAYQCETIRGAIAAIPSGQMEAGRSIGLNYMQTMRLVIMPQAVRICIPPLGNEMVNLVLNSSLAMVIGYAEITRQGKLIIATTFQIFWTWGMVMISYFVITWSLALFLRYLEEKTRIPGLGISGGA